MPTLGAHFSDDRADLVKKAAKSTGGKTVGQYISTAVSQRLERDGFVAGTEQHDIRTEALATADVVGPLATIEVLRKKRAEALAEKAAKVA